VNQKRSSVEINFEAIFCETEQESFSAKAKLFSRAIEHLNRCYNLSFMALSDLEHEHKRSPSQAIARLDFLDAEAMLLRSQIAELELIPDLLMREWGVIRDENPVSYLDDPDEQVRFRSCLAEARASLPERVSRHRMAEEESRKIRVEKIAQDDVKATFTEIPIQKRKIADK
jgi:hypothetical protein